MCNKVEILKERIKSTKNKIKELEPYSGYEDEVEDLKSELWVYETMLSGLTKREGAE